jgi:hypothetical protein
MMENNTTQPSCSSLHVRGTYTDGEPNEEEHSVQNLAHLKSLKMWEMRIDEAGCRSFVFSREASLHNGVLR